MYKCRSTHRMSPHFPFLLDKDLTITNACIQRPHLDQVALRGEAEAVDGVGPAVGPLAELLRRLGECHVGGDGAVDNGLWRTKLRLSRTIRGGNNYSILVVEAALTQEQLP